MLGGHSQQLQSGGRGRGGGKKGGGAVGLTSHKCTGVEEVDHSL